MSTDLALKSATELVALFRDKQASPVEAAEAAFARIDRHNPTLNAFVVVDPERGMATARASEARWAKGEPAGPVDGVPATIKDLVLTEGWPTLRGSKTVDRDQPWDIDAPATARLREGGTVLLGKTTTPEFGWKGVTDSPLTGITRNPWNTETTPGGSSGGAAAAAATGMGALHIGTDGGGSIRIPCALTGLFGIKATFGTVSAYPPSPFGTLANVGPMTRTVEDAATMLTVLAQPDPRDWYATTGTARDFREGIEDGVKGMRIAYSPSPSDVPVDPDIARLVAETVSTLGELGAEIVEADPPIDGSGDIFMKHWFAGAAHLIRDFTDEMKASMDPGFIAGAALGDKITRADYVAALDARQVLGFALHAFMRDYDLLVTPTLPVAAFAVGEVAPEKAGPENADEEQWADWTPWTYPFNLSRQPAASVPAGLTRDGLPAALQIVGPLHGETAILRAAYALQQARPWDLPPMTTA